MTAMKSNAGNSLIVAFVILMAHWQFNKHTNGDYGDPLVICTIVAIGTRHQW
jgi:hypothetical protein